MLGHRGEIDPAMRVFGQVIVERRNRRGIVCHLQERLVATRRALAPATLVGVGGQQTREWERGWVAGVPHEVSLNRGQAIGVVRGGAILLLLEHGLSRRQHLHLTCGVDVLVQLAT